MIFHIFCNKKPVPTQQTLAMQGRASKTDSRGTTLLTSLYGYDGPPVGFYSSKASSQSLGGDWSPYLPIHES